MLELKAIGASYGGIRALDGVSITVAAGEIVAVIGANGAGKSTTLMTISGVVGADAGQVLLDGEDITGLQTHEIVARGVVQVPEGRRIFPQLTVRENLDMGAYLRRDRDASAADRAYVYELFPRLAERKSQLGGTLSGGEQQMLAISRALMARPRLLLLDEPSLGLAPLIVAQIFSIIARVNAEQRTTVLLVEQNANLALRTATRGYVMETGRVVLSDSSERLMANPDVRSAYLGI